MIRPMPNVSAELLVFSDAHHRNQSEGQGPAGEMCSLRKLLRYEGKETRKLTSQTSIFQMFIGWGGSPVGVGHEKAGRQRQGRGTREQTSFTSSFKMLPEY